MTNEIDLKDEGHAPNSTAVYVNKWTRDEAREVVIAILESVIGPWDHGLQDTDNLDELLEIHHFPVLLRGAAGSLIHLFAGSKFMNMEKLCKRHKRETGMPIYIHSDLAKDLWSLMEKACLFCYEGEYDDCNKALGDAADWFLNEMSSENAAVITVLPVKSK